MLGPTGRALTWVTPASQEGFLLPLNGYLLKPDRPLKPVGAQAFRKCRQLGQWTVRLPVQGPLARLLMSRRCPSVHPPEYTQDQCLHTSATFPCTLAHPECFPCTNHTVWLCLPGRGTWLENPQSPPAPNPHPFGNNCMERDSTAPFIKGAHKTPGSAPSFRQTMALD